MTHLSIQIFLANNDISSVWLIRLVQVGFHFVITNILECGKQIPGTQRVKPSLLTRGEAIYMYMYIA